MSGHTLPPTGSRPCTLNSTKVLWIQKWAVKQRGRPAGGQRLVFEPYTHVTRVGSESYYTLASSTHKETRPAAWILWPWSSTSLLASLERMHFPSLARMTGKQERIAQVPLWREANSAEKQHLYAFSFKPNPTAFKSTASISNAKFEMRGLARSPHLLQYSHDGTADKLYQWAGEPVTQKKATGKPQKSSLCNIYKCRHPLRPRLSCHTAGKPKRYICAFNNHM